MSWGERTVEVPWFLKQEMGVCVLDIGSAESGYVNNLLDKGVKKLVLNDIRKFSTHEDDNRVECVVKDIRMCSPNILGLFDTVLCISTLEHMTLEAYGQQKDYINDPVTSQLEILEYMMKFVSKDGKLILTIPYGKYEHGGWVIVYDKLAIEKIKRKFEVSEETYFTLTDRDNDTWVQCSQNDCPEKGMDHYNGHMRATSVACLILKR